MLNFDTCLCCMMMFRSYGSINSQEYKSFEIYAVPINIHISMTEYHHLINGQAYHFSNTAVNGEKRVIKINLVTCLFSLFWST